MVLIVGKRKGDEQIFRDGSKSNWFLTHTINAHMTKHTDQGNVLMTEINLIMTSTLPSCVFSCTGICWLVSGHVSSVSSLH